MLRQESSSIQNLLNLEKKKKGHNSSKSFIPFLNERDSRGKIISNSSRGKYKNIRSITIRSSTKPDKNIFGDTITQSKTELREFPHRRTNFSRSKLISLNLQTATSQDKSENTSPLISKRLYEKSKFSLPKIHSKKRKEGTQIKQFQLRRFNPRSRRSINTISDISVEEDNSYIMRSQIPQSMREKYMKDVEERYKMISQFTPGTQKLEENVEKELKNLNSKFKTLQKKIAVSSYDYETNLLNFIREKKI